MKDGTCPKCDATDVVGNITQCAGWGHPGHRYGLSIGGALTGTTVAADIRAWICCECGHTEFYTKNARQLGKAVDKFTKQNQRIADKPIRVSAPDQSV